MTLFETKMQSSAYPKSMKIFICFMLMVSCLAAGELRVVSYNIHHGAGMDGKLDLQRIAGVIAKEKPDFVALQEVDKGVSRSGKVDQAAALGKMLGMHHAFAKFMDLGGGEYGLAVLSKHPILETHVHKLPTGAEPRVVLEVVSKVEGKKVSFVCIHLDWTKESLRVAQVKALDKVLEDRKHPVLLVGDYNAEPDSETMKLVAKSGVVVAKTGAKLTWPADKPNVEIDYVVVRGMPAVKATSQVGDEKVASDHRPLVGVIPWSVND